MTKFYRLNTNNYNAIVVLETGQKRWNQGLKDSINELLATHNICLTFDISLGRGYECTLREYDYSYDYVTSHGSGGSDTLIIVNTDTNTVTKHVKDPIPEVYTDRVKIELEKIVTEDYIRITSDCTSFVNRSQIQVIELEELLNSVKQLRKICKDNGTQIKGAIKSVKLIKEMYPKYQDQVNTYRENFNTLGKLWENHDLHFGYGQDEFYKDTLQELEFGLQKMNYRNTELFQVREFFSRINEYIEKIESGAKYSLISI